MKSALSGELAVNVLNALTANIAVLDADGVIIAVNDAWVRFGRSNGAASEDFYVGINYLSVCEQSLAAGDDPALREILQKLHDVIEGKEDEVCIEYPCDSPDEKRWFALRATRLVGRTDGGIVVAHEDITERRRIEQTLRETEHKLLSVLEALPVGVWIMDKSGRIVQGNPAALHIWGGARFVGPDEFGEYKAWWFASRRPVAAEEWAAARAIRTGEISIGEEIEIECFDGTRKIILNSAIPLLDGNQEIQGAIIVNEDITVRKRHEEELRRAKENVEAASRELAEALSRERIIARSDGLTGAVTRRYFFDLAEQAISVAVRYEHPLALILFDIDEFKQANDTLGHQAGDELLKRVARIGREHLRDADVFARYGGDEFVVLLPETAAAEAALVSERIRSDVAAQSIVTEKGVVHVTISSGVAALQPPNDTLDALIRRADVALYEAKHGGRNRTTVFSPPPAQPKIQHAD